MLTQKEKQLVKEYAKKLVNKKTLSKKRLQEAGEETSSKTDQELYDSIDWDAVGSAILNKIKINTKLSFESKSGRDGRIIVNMTSGDIINQCGIFKYAISSCFLTFFSTWLLDPKKHQGKIFNGSLNFSYPGNGMTIGNVTVYKTGKIVVELHKPR